jgi:iron complex outermembrane receptor protein
MRGILLRTVAVLALLTGGAAAQAPSPRGAPISIPAGSLPEAAAALTAATGTQVLWQGAGYSGRTQPVTRAASTEAALDAMLAGTGLTWRRGAGGAVEIVRVQTPDGAVALPEVRVQAGLIPPQAQIGNIPPPFAGGQVATGQRLGILGNRGYMETPFSGQSFTDQLIRDQQARTLSDVLLNDPSVRANVNADNYLDQFFIRGFRIGAADVAFNGLYGLVDNRRPAIEGIERVELLRGFNGLLLGVSPIGFIGGSINLVPKRAPEEPMTRITGLYSANANFGGAVDVARRFGPDNAAGVRLNAALRGGDTIVPGQSVTRGVATLGADYRGDRFRLSLDGGYQQQDLRRPTLALLNIPSTTVIPTAPRANRSWQQPWETNKSGFGFGLLRAEYDLAADWTAFAGYGLSYFWEQHFYTQTLTANSGPNALGDLRMTPALFTAVTRKQTGEAGVRGSFDTLGIRHDITFAGNFYRATSGSSNPFLGPAIATNIYDPVFVPQISRQGFPTNTPRTTRQHLASAILADTLSFLEGRVQITGGVRFQNIDNESFNPTTGARTARYDKSAWTPAFALLYRPIPELSLYANHIQALSPGPTAPATALNRGEVFAPLVSTQYEVGAKFERGGIGGSVALFQATQPSGFLNPATTVFAVDGEQRNRGLELTVFGAPRPDLRVLGGIAFLDGELVSTAGGGFNGKTAPGVPRVQFNMYGEYDLPFAPGLTATARGIATDRQFYDQANTQSIPSWGRLDLGARYRFALGNTPMVARFNIENVLGANYWQSTGAGFLTLGAPRTYLFSLSADL